MNRQRYTNWFKNVYRTIFFVFYTFQQVSDTEFKTNNNMLLYVKVINDITSNKK